MFYDYACRELRLSPSPPAPDQCSCRNFDDRIFCFYVSRENGVGRFFTDFSGIITLHVIYQTTQRLMNFSTQGDALCAEIH